MPLYEFVCNKCKKEFEEMCSFSEIDTMKCPECNGKSKKKLSVPVITFKGTGFYCTDNSSSSNGVSTGVSDSVSDTAKKESFSKGDVTRRDVE